MKRILNLLFIILITATVAMGQEICDNGIDDDNDGQIDLNDGDCDCDGFTTTVPSMIPNPSFEDRSCCPDDFSELYCADTWMQASNATSDYWNTCGASGNNYAGLPPQPAPDVDGYVGFINMDGWQEYIGACLSQPMLANHEYILNFWIGPSNMSPDFDLTFFGATDCNNLPFSGNECPVGQGTWQELTSIHVHFDSYEWMNLTVSFTPSQDIYALVFGPPCNSTSDYTYYYLDNLVLNVVDAFSSVNITATGHLCTNNMILHASSGVSGNWQWYYEGVAIPGATDSTLNVSALGYGTGAYQARISNSQGCDVAEYVVDVSYPDITVSSTTDVSCYNGNDGSIDVTVSGGTAPFSFNWNGPNGYSSTNEDISGIYAGTYQVTVTDNNGCTASTAVTISQPSQLDMTSSITHEQCPGYANGSIDISVSGGTPPYSYSWSNGSTTEDISGLSQGVYYVTVTDDNNCQMTNYFQVNTLYPTPTSYFSVDSVWCYQDTASVVYNGNASSNANFHWIFQEANVIAGSGIGPYQMNWINPGVYNISLWVEENGCVSDTTQATVYNPPPMQGQITGTDLNCYQDNTGQITTTVSGGRPPYTFIWNNGQTSQNLSDIPAGNYSVTIADSKNCMIHLNTIINQPEELVVSIPQNLELCNGQPITITSQVTGGTAPYTYNWSTGHTYPSITFSPNVDTTVYLTVTDQHGCTASAQTYIDVSEPLHMQLMVSDDSVCKGDKVILSIILSGGAGGPYLITNQNGIVVTPPEIVTIHDDTTFIISASDVCGSVATDTIEVVIYPMPMVHFVADTIAGCQPFTVNFNVTQGASQIANYIWNFGDNDNINLSLGANPEHTYNDDGTYTVSLMYTTDKGCKDTVTIYDMITVYKKPVAEFDYKPEVATITDPTIDFINSSMFNVLNFWSFGDGDSSIQVNPRHKYPNLVNNYTATLIVETEHGCKDTAVAIIEIQDVNAFYAPTAFTPDNDGMNELFHVVIRNIDTSKAFMLSVFDRWGELIWTTDKYDPQNPARYGWDGTVKNGAQKAPPDNYVWHCYYYTKDGNKQEKAGNVLLIR